MSFTRAASVLLLMSAAVPAIAQNAQAGASQSRESLSKLLENRFAGMDANHDGSVDKGEAGVAQDRVQTEVRDRLLKETDQEFAALDKNKDGQLSKDEFRATAPKLRPSAGPQAIITRFDGNKDGKVTLSEYQRPLLAQFDQLDSNKDGKLTQAEASKAPQGR
ncbi:MAG: EF-hand domain-containing protein [Sphingomicrobium sp.]